MDRTIMINKRVSVDDRKRIILPKELCELLTDDVYLLREAYVGLTHMVEVRIVDTNQPDIVEDTSLSGRISNYGGTPTNFKPYAQGYLRMLLPTEFYEHLGSPKTVRIIGLGDRFGLFSEDGWLKRQERIKERNRYKPDDDLDL